MKRYLDMSDALFGFPLDQVVVIDTETTGLDPDADEILSLAIVDGNGTRRFYSAFKPSRHLNWPDAQAVNGISPSMVKFAPRIEEKTKEIQEILGSDNVLVVGYNVGFDLDFLSRAIRTTNDLHVVDVMKLYRQYFSHANGSKLINCSKRFLLSYSAHHALADAIATAYCFRRIINSRVFYESLLDEKRPVELRLSLSQVKATRKSVFSLLDGSKNKVFDGELKLGQVTRGKNKGLPRYECHIHDEVVGVGDTWTSNMIRKYFDLGEDSELPDDIPVKARLSMSSSDRDLCIVTIDREDPYRMAIEDLAGQLLSENEEASEVSKHIDEEILLVANEEERRMAELNCKKKTLFTRLFSFLDK